MRKAEHASNLAEKKKRGAPKLPIGDLVVALSLGTYMNKASRKATAIARLLESRLFIRGKSPAAITLRLRMRTQALTETLVQANQLVTNSVRELETRFAIDSTYLKTPNSMIRVYRHGPEATVAETIKTAKLHVAVGLVSKMIVAAEVSDGEDSDIPYFEPLLRQLMLRFRVDEVLADAAYDVPAFYELVASCGGTAYIDQKSNTRKNGSPHHDAMVTLRGLFFDTWFDHYRFRTLVECVNSVIKRTIKRVVRARLQRSRTNEVLLICLVHNVLCLIRARVQYGLEIPWVDEDTRKAIDMIAKTKS